MSYLIKNEVSFPLDLLKYVVSEIVAVDFRIRFMPVLQLDFQNAVYYSHLISIINSYLFDVEVLILNCVPYYYMLQIYVDIDVMLCYD